MITGDSTRGGAGVVVWLTGLSGAGKTTIADAVARRLGAHRRSVEVLDGDVLRPVLSKGLGFSREDRDAHILRVAFVAHLLARNGVIVIVATISPFRTTRAQARDIIGDFVEVHVATPLAECVRRDVKGLYARAMAGEIARFTGISDPYEAPVSPELALDTTEVGLNECATLVLAKLRAMGYLEAP